MCAYCRQLIVLIFVFAITVSGGWAENIPTDTILSRLYAQAASLMEEGEYDSAQACFDRAFATEGVTGLPIYPILLNEQATLFFYVGELERSLEMKKSVLPYLPEVEDLEKHVSVYNDLGVLYHRFNRQDSSLYYYNKALDAAQAYGDKSWIGNLNLNLAVFYFNLRNYEDAEKHIDNALQNVLQTDDIPTTFAAWQVRSAIKAQMEKLEESGESVKEAWRLACGSEGNAEWKVRCIPGMYRYFQRKGQTDSINYYIGIGNKLLKELPANNVSAVGFIQTRGLANYEQKRYAEALKDFVYLYTNPTGSERKSLLEKMAVCYHHLGNPQKAFAYMDSARMWTDSLAKQEVALQMAEVKVKYETQEKELEIARLREKVLEQEADSLKIAVLLIFLLAGASVFMLIQRQRRKTAERELSRMKQEKELASAQSYIEGLEEECRHFAKELHDGIANDLFALEMKAQIGKDIPLAESIKQVRENVRAISHELMPPEFEQLGLDGILRHYAQNLSGHTGIKIDYEGSEPSPASSRTLPDRVAREVYRIAQEVTMNIVKHAAASHIVIRLTKDGKGVYMLAISDNGKSRLKLPSATEEKGIGLRTINDRTKVIRADVEMQSDEKGNRFILTFNTEQNEH